MPGTYKIGPIGAPRTKMGESARQGALDNITNNVQGTRTVIGVVEEIHDQSNAVKAYGLNDGSVLGGGRWIPLTHDPDEIVERWGTIRKGMKIMVTYNVPEGTNSIATIVAGEKRNSFGEDVETNDMSRGLYEIFAPGLYPG